MSPHARDAVVILEAFAPTRDGCGPLRPGEEPAADAALRRVLDALAEGTSVERRTRHAKGRVGISLLAAALAAGASAVAAARQLGDDRTRVVTCWGDAGATAQWEARVAPSASPAEACRTPWVDGHLGHAAPPSLAACATSTGAIAVVPGDAAACIKAGMHAAPSAAPDEAGDADHLQRALVDVLLTTCAAEHTTRDIVADALHEVRDERWQVVQVAAFSDDRPCGRVSVDPATHTIYVAPNRDE